MYSNLPCKANGLKQEEGDQYLFLKFLERYKTTNASSTTQQAHSYFLEERQIFTGILYRRKLGVQTQFRASSMESFMKTGKENLF